MKKLPILSTVARFTPFNVMLQFLPDLSESTYTRAKYVENLENTEDKKLNLRTKFSFEALYNFISFITSPEMISDLPYER